MLKQLQAQLTPLGKVLMARRFWWAAPLVAPGLALANPTGGTVTTGTATITSPDASTVRVDQTTASASINWQTFSVASNEYVIFNQPSASAVVLNRVIGGSASEIFGHLTANGRVFLVNPLGVVFGRGSQVDVGALVASTMDISDADFSAGRYVFTANGSTASITNAGTIRTAAGGFVVLAGDYVNNTGIIQAQVGQIVLASGSAMTLTVGGNGLINYQVDQAALSDRAGVHNAGELLADGGRVIMTAKVERSLLATVVNNEGLVQARSIVQGQNGEIVLAGEGGDVANSGTLDASGINGANGGTVRVVSDHATTLAPTSNIDTRGSGAVPVGGFVEVSGSTVQVQGALNIGKGGTFLLDPAQVTILNGSGASNGNSASGFIFEQTIENVLKGGANVEIVASNKIVVSNLADNVLDGRNAGSGGGLTLGIGTVVGGTPVGGGSYGGFQGGTFIRGPGQPGGGTITFVDKKDGIRVDGNLDVIAGSAYGGIDVGPLESVLGHIKLLGQTINVTNAAGSSFSDALNAGRSVDAYAEAGNLVIAGNVVGHSHSVSSGAPADVVLQATGTVGVGTITANHNIQIKATSVAAGDVYGGSSASIVATNGTLGLGNVVMSNPSGQSRLVLDAYGNITAGNIDVTGSLFSYAGAAATVVSHYGGVTMGNLAIGIPFTEGYGSLDISAKGNIAVGSVNVTGSTNAYAQMVSQIGTITLGDVLVETSFAQVGTVTLTASSVNLTGTQIRSGTIQVNGNLNAPGSLELEADVGSVQVTGATTAGPGNGDTIVIQAATSVNMGAITAGDDITVEAPGSITVGNVTAGDPKNGVTSYADVSILSLGSSGSGFTLTGNVGAGGNVNIERQNFGGMNIGALKAGEPGNGNIFVSTFAGDITGGGMTAGGNIRVSATGRLTLNGSIDAIHSFASLHATQAVQITGNVTGHYGSSSGPAVAINGGGVQVNGDITGYGSVHVYTGNVLPGIVGVTVNGNVTAYGDTLHPGNVDFDASGTAFAPESIVINGAVKAFAARTVQFTADYGNVTLHDVTVNGYGNGGSSVVLAATALGDGVTYGNISAYGSADTLSVSNTGRPAIVNMSADGNILINRLNVTGGGGSHASGSFGGQRDMASVSLSANHTLAVRNADIVGLAEHHDFFGDSSYGSITAGHAAANLFAGSNAFLGSANGHVRVEGYGGATLSATAVGNLTAHDLTVIAHAGSFASHRTGSFPSNASSQAGTALVDLWSKGGNVLVNGTVTETADGQVNLFVTASQGGVTLNGPVVLTANPGTHHVDSVRSSASGTTHTFTRTTTADSSYGNVDADLEGYNGVTIGAGGVTTKANGDVHFVAHAGSGCAFGSFGSCVSTIRTNGAVTVTGPLSFTNAGGSYHHTSHTTGFNSTFPFDDQRTTSGVYGSDRLSFNAAGNVAINGAVTDTVSGSASFSARSLQGGVTITGPVTLVANTGTHHSSSFQHNTGVTFTHDLTTSSDAVHGDINVDLHGYGGVTIGTGGFTTKAHGNLRFTAHAGSGTSFGASGTAFAIQGNGTVTLNGPLNLGNAGGTQHQARHSYGTSNAVAYDRSATLDNAGGSASASFYGGGNLVLPGFNLTAPGPVGLQLGSRNGSITVNGDVSVISKGGHYTFHGASGTLTSASSGPVGSASLNAHAQYGDIAVGNVDVEGFGSVAVALVGNHVSVGNVTVRSQAGSSSFQSLFGCGNCSAVDGRGAQTVIVKGSGASSAARLLIDTNSGSGYADVGTSAAPANVLVEGGDVTIGGTFTVHGNMLVHAKERIGTSFSHAPNITANAMSFAVSGPLVSSNSTCIAGCLDLGSATLHVGTGQVALGSDHLVNLVLTVFTPVGAPVSAAPNAAFSAAQVTLGNLDLAGDHVYIQGDKVSYTGTVTQQQHNLFVFYDAFTPNADIHLDSIPAVFPGANFEAPGPYPGTNFVFGGTLSFSDVTIGANGPLTLPNGENFVFLTNGSVTGLDQISTTGSVTFTQPLIDLAALSSNPLLTQFTPVEDPNKKKDYDNTGTQTGTGGASDTGETQQQTSSGLSCK